VRYEVQKNLLGGGGLEYVTELRDEIVTESVESVTESKAEPIEDIRRIVERWGEKLVPHKDASDHIKQPRWSKCWEARRRAGLRPEAVVEQAHVVRAPAVVVQY
jgi:hypothetical protein